MYKIIRNIAVLAIMSIMFIASCSERPNGDKNPSNNKTSMVSNNTTKQNDTSDIPLGERYCIEFIANDSMQNVSKDAVSPDVTLSNFMLLPASPTAAGAGTGSTGATGVGTAGTGVGAGGAGANGAGTGSTGATNNTTNGTTSTANVVPPVQNPVVVTPDPNANNTNVSNTTNSTANITPVVPLTLAQKLYELDKQYKTDWIDIVNNTKNIDCKQITANSTQNEVADAIAKQIAIIINFIRYYPNKYEEYISAYKEKFNDTAIKANFAQIEPVSTDEKFANIQDPKQAYIDLDKFIKTVKSSSMTYPHLSYNADLSIISARHSKAVIVKHVNTVTLDPTIEGGNLGDYAQVRINQYLHTLQYVSQLINSFIAENVGTASVLTNSSNTVMRDINVRLVALDIVFTYMLDPQKVLPDTERRIHAQNIASSKSCTVGVGVSFGSPKDDGTGKAFSTSIASTIDFMSGCEQK